MSQWHRSMDTFDEWLKRWQRIPSWDKFRNAVEDHMRQVAYDAWCAGQEYGIALEKARNNEIQK